jgi:putative transposase
MMFKPGQRGEEKWRKLRGFDYLARVIKGVIFKDRVKVEYDNQIAA